MLFFPAPGRHISKQADESDAHEIGRQRQVPTDGKAPMAPEKN